MRGIEKTVLKLFVIKAIRPRMQVNLVRRSEAKTK